MQIFSGILIFLSFLTTLYAYFFQNDFLIISGLLAWSALLVLFTTLKSKKLLIILSILSLVALFFSYIKEYEINFIKLFTVNQYLLTLLIGVGFLRLIATPKSENLKELPKGRNSFIKTYLGVHFFGSEVFVRPISVEFVAILVLLSGSLPSNYYFSRNFSRYFTERRHF